MAIDWKARDAERDANRARLAEIAPAIAAALGLTIKAQPSDDPIADCVRMEGPAGESVSLWVNRYGAKYTGKIEVSGGTWRVNPDGKAYVPDGVPSGYICVSLAKSAAEIVTDIKRRFMPAYAAELAAHREARAKYDQDRANEAARAGRLAGAVGASIVFQGERAVSLDLYRSRDLPGMLGEVSIQSDGVRFDRIDVPDNVAAEILAILVKHHKAPTE